MDQQDNINQQSSNVSVDNDASETGDNNGSLSNTKKLLIGIVTSIIIIAIILIVLYFMKIKPDNDLITSLQTEVNNYKKQLEEQKTLMNNNTKEVTEIKDKLKLNLEEIAKLNKDIENKTNELNVNTNKLKVLQTQVNENKEEINKLNKDIENKANTIKELNKSLTDKNAENANLNSALTNKTNDLKTSTEKVASLMVNISNLTAEMNTYKEVYDIIVPYVQNINTGNSAVTNRQKALELVNIMNGMKTKLTEAGYATDLININANLSDLVNKINIIKSNLGMSAVNQITESKINELINNRLSSLINASTTNEQAQAVYNTVKELINTPNITPTETITILNNIKVKLNDNISLYNSQTVNSSSPINSKIDNIFNNLSVSKSFYDLVKPVLENNLNPAEYKYYNNYNIPTTQNNITATNIKDYIENSLKFIKYIRQEIVPLASNENSANINLNSLDTLKTRLDSLKTLSSQVSDLNNQVASLNAQITSLNSDLASYKFNGVDGNFINKNKLRNVMLTQGWDIYNIDPSNESLVITADKGPAFDIGYCISNPSICGVQIAENKNSNVTNKIYKRNTQGMPNSLRLSREENKNYYILLNEPSEIKFNELGDSYYDSSKPTHVKTKILEKSLLMNTGLDDSSASEQKGNLTYPDCLNVMASGGYNAAKIGQYGPIYGGELNGYVIDNSAGNISMTTELNDNTFPTYRKAAFYETTANKNAKILLSSGKNTNGDIWDMYTMNNESSINSGTVTKKNSLTEIDNVSLCPEGNQVVYISKLRVAKTDDNQNDDGSSWTENGLNGPVKINDKINSSSSTKDSITISDRIKNLFGKNNFNISAGLNNIKTDNGDPYPGSRKTMQMIYKCGKPTYPNTGPWCNLYKKQQTNKLKLYPKSGQMVYINDPSAFDFTGI